MIIYNVCRKTNFEEGNLLQTKHKLTTASLLLNSFFAAQLILIMNTEESFCIKTSSISQNLMSFKLPSGLYLGRKGLSNPNTFASCVIEVIGFNRVKNCCYCLYSKGKRKRELQIIKINLFLQNATVIACFPQNCLYFNSEIARSSMNHKKDLIGVIELSERASGNITPFYGCLWIFHVESGMIEEFTFNRAKRVVPFFPINSFFHLENKGWLLMNNDGKVYTADIDHRTNDVSWKYLTIVPYKECGAGHKPVSPILAVKEKFFCSFQGCNNVAIYDGRNDLWTVTQVEPNCSSSLFVSPFELGLSGLVCFSDEPMFVSRDGNIFPLHNSLKGEFHHLSITCLPVQECMGCQIFQHQAKGMIVINGYDHDFDSDYCVAITTVDIFYTNVQSLQDLAFKTLSMYYYSSFKSNVETFKSMLNLSSSLKRKYF